VNQKLEHVDDISFIEQLYEEGFIHGLLKKKEKRLAPYFNFTFRYIDGILSIDNSRFW
jgi:hypothetical protein